jgi:hypothetical protein
VLWQSPPNPSDDRNRLRTPNPTEPLQLGTGREPDLGCPLGCRLPAGGTPLLRLPRRHREAQLADANGFVYRYRTEDGLPGDEGPLLICTFWLAQALAMAGQVERAVQIFERAATAW